MKILLLHAIRDLRSLRRTTLNQSFCLLKHAQEHEYTLHCFGHAVTSELREREFDAIVIDTTFLWYRWARPRSILAGLMEEYRFIEDSHAVKVALPQDDYDHAAILDEWLAAWGVDAVFTPLAKHATLLFPLTTRRAAVLPCFSGHLDPADRAVATCLRRPFEAREIDVGYRAADLPAQFGRLGRIKSEIGQRFVQALGPDHGLRLEISIDPRDVLSGDRWLRFLCNSRFTLGSVSGSSVVDPYGRIGDAIRIYTRGHPGAPFNEIEAACFPGQDGEWELAGIGPRNIETALAESCQILVPSLDLAPFEPDVHYIPLAPDCSNIVEVRRQMLDTVLVKQRIAAALQLVCETPSFRSENFARRILAEVERLRGCHSPAIPQPSDAPRAADAVQSLLAEQRITLRLAEAELAQRVADVASVAAVEQSLNLKLALRTGRFGGLREMLGVNDAILPGGSIDWRVPRTFGLRAYLMLRRARDRVDAARDLLRRGRHRLGESQQRFRELRQRLRGNGIRGGLRAASAKALSVRRAIPRRLWPLLNTLRRNLLPSALVPLRRAMGSTPRPTITMLVADNRIDRRVLLSARSLYQAGWRVRVIALPYPGPRDDDQRMFPEIDILRIVPHRYPAIIDSGTIETGTPLASRGWEWQGVYPYYFHFLALATRHPAQILVAHDLPVLASAIVAAHSLGARVAYDAHELYPEQHHFKPEFVDALSRAEAELIGYAELVTTVNQSIAQDMAARYGIPRPAVILNAPAASPKALPLPRTMLIRDRLGLAASQRILLFQGGLSPNRNLETLVRAMAFVRRSETVLVFLGPDGGKRDELEQIARELGLLGSRIHFLDPVPQDELLSWTAGGDVGIVPYPPIDLNSRLCTPNKLFEFIVAEVPILANDLPELRSFVVENGFGIARPMHSPRSIAAAIDEVMSSDPSAWRAALRARGAEFVWDLQGKEVVRLYERFRTSRPACLKETASTSDIASNVEDKL